MTATQPIHVETDAMLQQVQLTGQQLAPGQMSNQMPDLHPDDYDHLVAENRSLQTLNRDLETFVYAISHDLRAPLRTIRGFSQLLAGDIGQPLNDATARDVAGIQTGVDRMQQMIARWLKLAQWEHGNIQRQPVDLSAIANAQLNELRMTDPGRSITAVVTPNMVAFADQVLVEGLLQNLLSNAWKFTQHNNGTAMIEVRMHEQNGQAVFSVSDNGIGFPQADASKLFRPFQRLPNAARFGGTGIGLVVAQRIVERHGGRIWAQAELNQGATFSFTLAPASTVQRGEG